MRTLILLAAFAILLAFAVKQPNETAFDAATTMFDQITDTPQSSVDTTKLPETVAVQPTITPQLPALPPEIVVKQRPTPKPVPTDTPSKAAEDPMPAIEAMYREALRLLAEK